MNSSPFGHMLYSLDKNPFLNVSMLDQSQGSVKTLLFVTSRQDYDPPLHVGNICRPSVKQSAGTQPHTGYLVLTDGQQTHQVPVRVHQEAALEIQSHTDNLYNE